jgi:protein SCO1/2
MKHLSQILILAVLLSACQKTETVKTEPTIEESVHPILPPSEAITDGALLDLESIWQNQNAKDGTLATHLGGKIQIISMGYSTCEYACPALIADMRRILKGIDPAALGTKVGFSFISIDPDTDTTARLKEFEKESLFDPNVWTLLRSNADNVLELAVVLGMKYRQTTVDDFAHSSIITILSPEGTILHQQIGINIDPAESIKRIETTLALRGKSER